MSSRNDDMVIDPQLEGSANQAASTSVHTGRQTFGRDKRRGGLLRRAAQVRQLRKARAARAARTAKGVRASGRFGAGRLIARGGVAAVIVAMVIAAVRLKGGKSGKNLKQMGQAAKSWAAGEALLVSAASQMARQDVASRINWTAFESEGRRADKARGSLRAHQDLLVDDEGGLTELGQAVEMSGHIGRSPEADKWIKANNVLGRQTENRAVTAHKITYDKIKGDKLMHMRGLEELIMRKEFTSQSDLDLLILRGGEAIKAAKQLSNQMLRWAQGR